MKKLLLLFFIFSEIVAYAQVKRVPLGQESTNFDSTCGFSLVHRIRNYESTFSSPDDVINKHIDSPKSATVVYSKNKFYINSLESCETLVFSIDSFSHLSTISHCFTKKDSSLFHEKSALGYDFLYKGDERVFCGKPVESCLSHNGKYLWTTYYRRSFDKSAVQPSAIAIIDTDSDSIVRVLACGPLPKMICASPDGKYVAVTHWGDNTIGIIDVSSNDCNDFHYVSHFVVDEKLSLNSKDNTPYNRDQECGFCLRGSVFTPDSKYLLVGRMGGGGIAVFDMNLMKYEGTVWGMKTNVRHLLIADDYVFLSANKPGYVQKAPLNSILSTVYKNNKMYSAWQEVFVGVGARTIDITPDHKYILAAVNNESKVVMLRTYDMKIVAESTVDSYPVGLTVFEDGKHFIVTSQGRNNGGGNSVMIFKLNY